MAKIDRFKKKKENREAFKKLRKEANKKDESERIEFARTRKAKDIPLINPGIPNG